MLPNHKASTLFIVFLFALSASAFSYTQKMNVAVLPFTYSNDISSASGIIISDALSDEIIRTGKARVLERSQINSILSEQGFQNSGACDASECAVEMGKLLSVQNIIVGSVGKLGGSYSISIRMVNVSSGEIVKSVHAIEKGGIDDLVVKSLPNLAGDLMGTLPMSPKSSPSSLLSSLGNDEIQRHDSESKIDTNFKMHINLLFGMSSIMESPVGIRGEIEYNGFGAGIGVGPLIPGIGIGENWNNTMYIPTLALYYVKMKYKFEATYGYFTHKEDKSKSYTSITADLWYDIGAPEGWKIIVGLGYMNETKKWDGAYSETSSFSIPIPIIGFSYTMR